MELVNLQVWPRPETVADADEFVRELNNFFTEFPVPTYGDYEIAARSLFETAKIADWMGLDSHTYPFYSALPGGDWYNSSDNAYGGVRYHIRRALPAVHRRTSTD